MNEKSSAPAEEALKPHTYSIEEMESWYVDQAMFGDSFAFSAYTPYGIRQLDSEYCSRLLSAKTQEEVWEIAVEIGANPHLHGMIKQNLLDNANRIEIEMETRKKG